ncbi:hypothetical protein J7H98_003880 [Vibrio parahaemolyticus]|nr:hypothetical protein [Vibrio parahaemolyticus]
MNDKGTLYGDFDEHLFTIVIVFNNDVVKRFPIVEEKYYFVAHEFVNHFEDYLSSGKDKIGKFRIHKNGNFVCDFSKVASVELEVKDVDKSYG